VWTIRNGRVGTAMPAFQRPDAPALSDQDIADVVAHLRGLLATKEQKMARNGPSRAPSGGRP